MRVAQPAVRRPPGTTIRGTAAFLRALAAGDAVCLATWVAGERPDAAWAAWLSAHGLAAFAYHRLRAAAALSRLPAASQSALRGAFYNAAGDAELHDRELAAVLAGLAAAGVTPVVFKGAALAHTVYPDPACRSMGDLDLWIPASEMHRAQAVLEAWGYAQYIKPHRPTAFQRQAEGEVQLCGRTPGSGLVELHWGIFPGEWLRRTAIVDQGGIYDRVVPTTLVGQPARVLAAEDAVIQLAVHIAVTHQFASSAVRGLMDIALLARWRPVDWAVVAQRAAAWRVGVATWQTLTLARALTGLDDSAAACTVLAPSPLRRWLLRLFINEGSLLGMRDLTRGPARFMLQLLLVDRLGDAARLLGRAIWPEAAWLALRYGAATPAIRARHLWFALQGRM